MYLSINLSIYPSLFNCMYLCKYVCMYVYERMKTCTVVKKTISLISIYSKL